MHDAHGVARFPAQLAEAAFHATAAVVLLIAARRGWLRGRRIAAYLALYAVVRFLLEFVRANPPVAFGLTYYQFLALALFALAGGTWWVRSTKAYRGLERAAVSSPAWRHRPCRPVLGLRTS